MGGAHAPGEGALATRGITHVGLTVPDLDRAVEWYVQTLGWQLMFGPVELESDDSFTGRQVREVFARDAVRFRLAHLDAGGETVVEMFEFLEPPAGGPASFEFWRTGVFHLCLTCDAIEDVADAIADAGGRKCMAVQPIVDGEPYLMCYCADPFGNIIELYSHDHREVFDQRGGN